MSAPLAGLRVVDATVDRAGSIAGMLLADLGAAVTRICTHDGRGVRPSPSELPDAVCWDRGKSTESVTSLDPGADGRLAGLLAAADVLLVDETPHDFERSSLHPSATNAHAPRLITVWTPAYGANGDRYQDLPGDPLLQAAITSFALHQPAFDPSTPIAPVINAIEAIQGSLAASAAVAGGLDASRSGRGQLATVSGVDAAGALLATLVNETLDVEKLISITRHPRLGPFFRPYRCGDGQTLFLATLVEPLFVAALGVLDAVEVMLLDGVDGQFFNFARPDVGSKASSILEERFAAQPRQYWLDRLAEAGVPAEPVQSRGDWLASEEFAATGGCHEFDHPVVGRVSTPSHPVTVEPGGTVTEPERCWPASSDGVASQPGPLAGLRVIDMSTFLAGPFGPALMAFWGADVVKVEPAYGDPYRPYGVSYLAVNQAKHSVRLDFDTPEGRAQVEALIAGADVMIDNLRPSARQSLGLGIEVLRALNPALVHGNITAFGPGPFAERPGFDPSIQALSGMMWATGGDDEPLNTSTPVHDVAAGASMALGVLAAVWQRAQTGVVSSVTASLAASSSLLQCAELTMFEGRIAPPLGRIDNIGDVPTHCFHHTADGWIAVAAPSIDALSAALGVPGDAITATLGAMTVDEALGVLSGSGIAASAVIGETWGSDSYLDANGLSHVVIDPTFGRCRVMRGAGSWSRSGVYTVDRMVESGADTERVAAGGWSALGREA